MVKVLRSSRISDCQLWTLENQKQMDRSAFHNILPLSKPINNIFLLAWTQKNKIRIFHFIFIQTHNGIYTQKMRVLFYVIKAMRSFKCLITCKKGGKNTQRRWWVEEGRVRAAAAESTKTKVDITRRKRQKQKTQLGYLNFQPTTSLSSVIFWLFLSTFSH